MKITKAQLRQIIKEELDMMQEVTESDMDVLDYAFGKVNEVSQALTGLEDTALRDEIEGHLEQVRDLMQPEEMVHEKIEKADGGYFVTSKSGKRLSKKPHKTKKDALAQLGAVEASKAGRSK